MPPVRWMKLFFKSKVGDPSGKRCVVDRPSHNEGKQEKRQETPHKMTLDRTAIHYIAGDDFMLGNDGLLLHHFWPLPLR